MISDIDSFGPVKCVMHGPHKVPKSPVKLINPAKLYLMYPINPSFLLPSRKFYKKDVQENLFHPIEKLIKAC